MWHGKAMAMPALRWEVRKAWILLRSFTRMNPTHRNIKQVLEFTGVCSSTIYEMMDEDSPYYNRTFPKKVTISQNVLAGQLGKSINGLRTNWRVENSGSFCSLIFLLF